MKNLNYSQLREASRTNVGSDAQIMAGLEMIKRANATGVKCYDIEQAMDVLDNVNN